MNEALKIAVREVFIDASKRAVRCENLYHQDGLDVRPIFLIRDGRSVAHSFSKRGRTDFKTGVKWWVRYNLGARRMLKRISADYFQLRYEDLCEDPASVVADLHRFLGLEPEPWPPVDGLPIYHVPTGHRIRTQFTGEIRKPESWKDKISVEEQAIFEKLAGDLSRELGY